MRLLALFLFCSCTVDTPSALNRVAYRKYVWKLGDSGNEQYRIVHMHEWPVGVWKDEEGKFWREFQHPRRFQMIKDRNTEPVRPAERGD